MPNYHSVQYIWTEFLVVYNKLYSHIPMNSQEVGNLRIKVNGWLAKFLSVYKVKNVTPYIHLLTCHILQFLRKYGTIASFSQQGLEKLINVITKDYFNGTNHCNYLTQILMKLNHLEELSDEGCIHSKDVLHVKKWGITFILARNAQCTCNNLN